MLFIGVYLALTFLNWYLRTLSMLPFKFNLVYIMGLISTRCYIYGRPSLLLTLHRYRYWYQDRRDLIWSRKKNNTLNVVITKVCKLTWMVPIHFAIRLNFVMYPLTKEKLRVFQINWKIASFKIQRKVTCYDAYNVGKTNIKCLDNNVDKYNYTMM